MQTEYAERQKKEYKTKTNGQRQVVCRCPMCEPGKDMHKIYMDWQGKAKIPVKICAKHRDYDEVLFGTVIYGVAV